MLTSRTETAVQFHNPLVEQRGGAGQTTCVGKIPELSKSLCKSTSGVIRSNS